MIYTTDGSEIYNRGSIAEFIEKSGDSFSFVHRSYIVNNMHISSIHPYEIVLYDGSQIPVPKKRYAEIKNKLIAFYKK